MSECKWSEIRIKELEAGANEFEATVIKQGEIIRELKEKNENQDGIIRNLLLRTHKLAVKCDEFKLVVDVSKKTIKGLKQIISSMVDILLIY